LSTDLKTDFTNGFSIFLWWYWSIKKFFRKKFFFCFQNLDALYRPVAGKLFVLEDFVLGTGTSVASALTVETIFEIMKCVADVDMLPRRRMGQNAKFSGFSILGKPTIEIFRFFDIGHPQ